jgi:WD40 repeat protein
LVAKNGWICSGGETGEFTAIDLNEDRFAPDIATDDAALEQALDSNPDASQLLEHSGDLVSSLRVRQSIRTLAHARKNLVGKSKQFGKERVNCITLWFPPTTLQPFEGAYDEPVAVLANNDKSVAIVSLRSQELLIEIEYPDCVNRAVCSPDGRLLIAISDDPYLYIYEQACINGHTKETLGSAYKPIFRWTQRNKIHLISQSKEDRSDNRGSFAACFSSSGRYLAVGTQYGAISIFDTTTITDPEVISLVTSFTTSRPNNTLGAVRAMEFAPGPVDLLAWTEDRGRVGVADMRNGCISRQIIHLDKEDDYDHISLSDRGSIDPRLLDSRRSDRTDISRLIPTSNASLAEVSRHLATGGVTDADIERLNQPLTPDETRVLEALQVYSRRREERAAHRATTTQRLLGGDRPSDTRRTAADAARTERSAIVSAAVNDVLGSIRDIRDQRDRIRENMERQERIRSYAREEAENEELRRRGGAHARPASSSGLRRPQQPSSTAAPAGSEDALSARRALASRLMGDLPPSTSAWSDLEALWNLSFDTTPQPTIYDSTRHAAVDVNLRGPVDADTRRRDRAAFLIREWETNPARRMGLGLRHSIADPFDTAGLAWSDDGRKL